MIMARALWRLAGAKTVLLVFRCSHHGQVLIEGLVALGLTTMVLALGLELVRSAQQKVLMRHSCFMYLRLRALGREEEVAMERTKKWMKEALPPSGERFFRHTELLFEGATRSALAVSRYSRFLLPYPDPAFARDRLGSRDRIQFTERCFFLPPHS
ncbi:MAG: hypothetical protein HYR96_13020 [Deltaproteobacteria bacterium]|nr:hypothetical protein [Deltaproteobacteria bacterium]MBI3293954.1 hypothetical protein [Deltaproteobacteria bacterium]